MQRHWLSYSLGVCLLAPDPRSPVSPHLSLMWRRGLRCELPVPVVGRSAWRPLSEGRPAAGGAEPARLSRAAQQQRHGVGKGFASRLDAGCVCAQRCSCVMRQTPEMWKNMSSFSSQKLCAPICKLGVSSVKDISILGLCLLFFCWFLFFFFFSSVKSCAAGARGAANVKCQAEMEYAGCRWIVLAPGASLGEGESFIWQHGQGEQALQLLSSLGYCFFLPALPISVQACGRETVEDSRLHTRKMDGARRMCCVKSVRPCPCLGCAVPLILWET